MVTGAADQTPTKHIVFIDGSQTAVLETRSTTVARFLLERGIVPEPADRVSAALDASVVDGQTLIFRQAVPVRIIVDGGVKPVMTAATRVGDVLVAQHLALGARDLVEPSVDSAVTANGTIRVTRTTSWLEHVWTAIAPQIERKFDLTLRSGQERVIDAGAPGTKETTIEVLQPNPRVEPRRLVLSARVLRFPRAKVIASGVGDYSALAGIARRGLAGTLRLADQALRMVATAYSGACSGCSGLTASGRPAGSGVVAVDPRYIPLGSHLFIPGYGKALAGDTGGAIRGNRIDLGFDSERDAMTFGRRPIVVYVLK